MNPAIPRHCLSDADHLAIDRLARRYADLIDRRAWGELADLFTPEAVITIDLMTSPVRLISGADGLREFLESAMARFRFLAFVIQNLHVEPFTDDPDLASARMFMSEHRIDLDGSATQTFGCYQDTYQRVGGSWRFARREYQTIARLPDADVFDLPAQARPLTS